MTGNGRRGTAPRILNEVAWALGLEGKRLRIGMCRDEPTRVLRELLLEAEDRAHDVRDARQARLRRAWKGVRQEAEDRGVALGTMHNGRQKALEVISRWWSGGERARVQRVLALPDGEVQLSMYRRARREIAAGRVPSDTEPVVFRMALDSVRASWWRQPPPRRGMQLVEECLALSLDMLEGQREIRDRVAVVAARMGVPEDSESFLYEAVRRAVYRIEEGRRQRAKEQNEGRGFSRRRTRWVPEAS